MEPLRLQWDMPDHPIAKHHLAAIGTVDKVGHVTNASSISSPSTHPCLSTSPVPPPAPPPAPPTGDSSQPSSGEGCDRCEVAQCPRLPPPGLVEGVQH